MTKHTSVSPAQLRSVLSRVEALTGQLRAELDDVAGLPYSQLPGPDIVQGRHTGHPDPTGMAATTSQHIKAHFRRGAVMIMKAEETLQKARAAFGDAIKAADSHEDFRDPEGLYGRPIKPDPISKAELKEARQYKERRDTRRTG